MKVNVVVLFAILALVPGAFAAPLCSGAGGTLDFGVNTIAEGSVEAATFTCAGLQFNITGANLLTVVFFEPSGLVSDILTLTNVSPTLANINFVSDTELPLNLPPPPFSTITEPGAFVISATLGSGERLSFSFVSDVNEGPTSETVTIAAIPEPATLLLIGSAVIGLAVFRRARTGRKE